MVTSYAKSSGLRHRSPAFPCHMRAELREPRHLWGGGQDMWAAGSKQRPFGRGMLT